MKKISILPVFFACALILSSCEEEKPDVLVDEAEFATDAVFDNLTPEQQKATIAEAGVELATELNTLSDQGAINTAASLNKRMSSSQKSNNAVLKLIADVASLSEDKNNVYNVMKSLETTDPVSLQEEWKGVVGTYDYNFTTKEFPETPKASTDNTIVFNFPGSETATTNTAKLVISNFKTANVTSGEISKEMKELPTSIKAELSVNGKVEMVYVFAASYKSDGVPTSVNTSLTIGTFVLSAELLNTSAKVSSEVAFKNGSKNIISFGEMAEGNFSDEAIKALDNDEEINKVLYKASAFVAIFDMKLIGSVDVKNMAPEMTVIDDKYDPKYEAINYNTSYLVWMKSEYDLDKEKNKESVVVANKYVDIILVNTEIDKKICEGDFYVVNNEIEMDSDLNIKLKFGDGSSEDIETYFEKGFDAATNKFEDLVDKMDKKMGNTTTK